MIMSRTDYVTFLPEQAKWVIPPYEHRQKKKLWGGQLENTNLLKKGICLLNTFLKDFTKMPIKKNTVLQFDGGDIPPLPKS